jgi:hypothetical protein
MRIPSQVAFPSGTIAIATGIAPEVCIAGNAAPLTVGTEPIAPVAPVPADMFIELVVVLELAGEDPAPAAVGVP